MRSVVYFGVVVGMCALVFGSASCSDGTTGSAPDGGDDSASTCSAPRMVCDVGCLDVTKDHEHCGSCDTACGATEICIAGGCVPCKGTLTEAGVCLEKLFNADGPAILRANETDVYWGSRIAEKSEGVFRHPVPAGLTVPIATIPAPYQTSVGGIALFDGYFYWTTTGKQGLLNGSVLRVALPGSASSAQETVASLQGYPQAIVGSGDSVFWANADTGEIDFARTNPLSSMGRFVEGFATPSKLALNDKYLFVLDVGLGKIVGSVVRVGLHGEPKLVLAPNVDQGTAVAASAERVYWARFGELWDVGVNGGEPRKLWADDATTGGRFIRDIVTDGTTVYFSEDLGTDGGAVYALDVASSSTKLLAKGDDLGLVRGLEIRGGALLVAVGMWPTRGGVYQITPR